MKKTIIKLLFAALLGMVYLVGCNPDETDDMTPDDSRDKYTGTWTCQESSSLLGNSTYTVIISKDSNSVIRILMENFYHLGYDETVYGAVNGDVVNIPLQNACNGTIEINGTGNMLNKNRIDWVYYADDGADIDTITAVYTR